MRLALVVRVALMLSITSGAAEAAVRWCDPHDPGECKDFGSEQELDAYLQEHMDSERLAAQALSRPLRELVVAVLSEAHSGPEPYCLWVLGRKSSTGLRRQLRSIGHTVRCKRKTRLTLLINRVREIDSGRFILTYAYHCGSLCAGEVEYVVEGSPGEALRVVDRISKWVS